MHSFQLFIQEQKIVHHLLDMEKRFYSVTANNIQTLAYEVAEKIIFHTTSILQRMLWVKTG